MIINITKKDLGKTIRLSDNESIFVKRNLGGYLPPRLTPDYITVSYTKE